MKILDGDDVGKGRQCQQVVFWDVSCIYGFISVREIVFEDLTRNSGFFPREENPSRREN